MKKPLRFQMVDDESKLPLAAQPLVLAPEDEQQAAAALLHHLGLSPDSPPVFRDRCAVLACYDAFDGTNCYYSVKKTDGKKPSVWK